MRVTQRKLEANRRNGAKSKGPISDAGKMRSAANSITHGLSARPHCLATESREDYEANRQIYVNRFQPMDGFEAKLVNQLAGLDWRLQRAGAIETAVLDMEIDILQPEIEHAFQSMDAEGLWALGFKSLSDHSHVLVNLDRQQTRLFRQYHRVARHLAEAQASRRMDHINEPTAPHAFPGEEPSCQAA